MMMTLNTKGLGDMKIIMYKTVGLLSWRGGDETASDEAIG